MRIFVTGYCRTNCVQFRCVVARHEVHMMKMFVNWKCAFNDVCTVSLGLNVVVELTKPRFGFKHWSADEKIVYQNVWSLADFAFWVKWCVWQKLVYYTVHYFLSLSWSTECASMLWLLWTAREQLGDNWKAFWGNGTSSKFSRSQICKIS